jgi:hypothetical protein
MPLTENEKAVEKLTRELHSLGVETQPDGDKLKIRFAESPRRQIKQLLKDGGWQYQFLGMTPRLNLADGRMPLWHIYSVSLDRQPGDNDGTVGTPGESSSPSTGVGEAWGMLGCEPDASRS